MKKIIILLLASLSASLAYADTSSKTDPALSVTTIKPPAIKDYLLNHVTGSFDVTNNYVWRGISQTDNGPAVQGSLTYTFDSKFYLSLWGSNVNFQTNTDNTATTELDEIVGYSNRYKEDIAYDIYFIRYDYPRASEANYNEVVATASYKWLVGLVGYSLNAFNSHVPGRYFNLGFNINLPTKYVYLENLSLQGGVGYFNLNNAAGRSYMDYNLQLQKVLSDRYTFALQWTDTNGANDSHPLDGNNIAATLTANF